MPAPPLKAAAFKLFGKPQPRLDIPAKVDGHGDLRHRRAPARPALCRGPQCADLRRQAERLHGEGQPAQGRRGRWSIVPGGDRRHRRQLVARQQASRRRHRRAVAGRARARLDSADACGSATKSCWRADGRLDAARSATTATPAQAQHRSGLPRAVPRARADGADELHGPGQRQAVEVWVPTQSPTLMRLAAAGSRPRRQADVTVHTTFLGGGFGRRVEVDSCARRCACAARRRGRPVQVLWSREEDIRHDYLPADWRWRAAGRARRQGR